MSFMEVWRIKKFLGSGGFADVYAASSREGVTGAVRVDLLIVEFHGIVQGSSLGPERDISFSRSVGETLQQMNAQRSGS